ncbi:MAG TPA: DUF1269 domain-containing protein [Gemmatimonadaceae bacterium]|nr:DUF1269 domain-containing protein [Gemmatimonadaceae bacterium]
MAELVVIGFEGKHRAAEVLDQLEVMNETSLIDLKDAVAVYRTDDGRLRVDKSAQPTTSEGAAGGALLGGMIGALLLAPFTGGLSAATAAGVLASGATIMGSTGAALGAVDAQDFKRQFGISEEFVDQVGGMVQPGQSAAFVLAQASDPKAVAEQFRGYGGKVLRTTLSGDAAKRFEKVMAPQTVVSQTLS